MRISAIIICFFLIFSAIFFPLCVKSVQCATKPDYVGVDVDDVYVWKVGIDKDPFEDFLEDSEVYSKVEIDNITDIMFNDAWEEDVKGWRIAILDIKDEREFDYGVGKNDGVRYLLNWYITEDYEKTVGEEEEMNGKGGIARYDKKFYAWRANSIMGLYYLIVANNIKWDKVAAELNEELEDEYDGGNEEGSAETVKSLYEDIGICTVINIDNVLFDDFEATSKYNDDGVLMYYEWKYDGEPIILLELENQIFNENWEVIVIGALIVGITALVIIVVKKIIKD